MRCRFEGRRIWFGAGNSAVVLYALLLGLLANSSCVYFNTFYNAKKAFRQAEKARAKQEREAFAQGRVLEREEVRGSGLAKPLYEEAAQKASRVLEKFKESDLIDDAMFLMGRAFYWQGDYLSAVQSFRDLEKNFPESEFYDRTLYWRALSHEAQNLDNLATPIYRTLFEGGGGDVAARAGLRLGEIAFRAEDYVVAVQEYRATLDAFPDTELRAELWLRLGESIFALEDESRYDEALEAFARVLEEKSTIEMEYRARLSTGRLLDMRGDSEAALRTYTRLLKESRFRPFEGQTRILIGQYYQENGQLDRALEEFGQVRDDFPQTPSSAMALYRTGLLYLRGFGESERGAEYFEEAKREKGGSEASKLAQEMLGYLAQLKQHTDRIHQADSLVATPAGGVPVVSPAADSLGGEADSLALEGAGKTADSAAGSAAGVDGSGNMDSLAVGADGEPVDVPIETAIAGVVEPVAMEGVGASADSTVGGPLSSSDSRVAEESGDLPSGGVARTPEVMVDLLAVAEFYRDPERVAQPDSAIHYFGEILRRFPDSESVPRILYSIAWVYREMRQEEVGARPYLERLIEEFPATRHANEARRHLGLEIQVTDEELAAVEFEEIEAVLLRDAGALEAYIPLLDSLSFHFKDTEVGAKAAYLAAHAYENAGADSLEAERRYAQVREAFSHSRYGRLVAERDSVRAGGLVAKLQRSLKGVGGRVKPGERIEVLALEPDSLDSVSLARKYLGFAMRAQRREAFKEAREFYELSLEQRESQPEVLYQLGNIMREQDFLEDAIELYQESLAMRRGMLKAQYRLLDAFIATGQIDSANHYLRQIVKRDRRNPQVEFLLQEFPDLEEGGGGEELSHSDFEELGLEPPEEDLKPSFQNQLEDLPLVRELVRPVFPEESEVDSATVFVDLLIGRQGEVEEADLFSGEERFGMPALAAARDYRFYPAIDRKGEEMRVWVELEIPFVRSAGKNVDVERPVELPEVGRAMTDTVSAEVGGD
jgi:tetratricopeptide (TPR) repeat protein